MKFFGNVMAVIVVGVLGGCATITRGSKEVLVIESEPVGAKVTTSIGLTGTTPATFKVSRKGGFTVTIEKEGYQPVTVQVSSQIAGAGAAGMAGNIILGGLIGAAVDAGSGATRQLKPNPISVKLVSLEAAKDGSKNDGDANLKSDAAGSSTDTETSKIKSEEESLSFQIDVLPISRHHMLVSVIEEMNETEDQAI
ncbi:MAG TPA: PEGA domain-containing protein [Candidatus Hydrogenedentes bacterium]|nr:PEGA domain-containing protein [Candidatus Hydrogenedentota bacterium]HQH52095.1 PEGA domain-containing protein [Candidatus Hydrogenedentota bacterium]